MSSEPLGEARIDFVGDVTKLKAAAREAEAIGQKAAIAASGGAGTGGAGGVPTQAESTAATAANTVATKEAEIATVGLNAALKEKGHALKDSVSGVHSLVAAFGRIIGVGGLVVGALKGISEWLQQSEIKARNAWAEFAKVAESLDDMNRANMRAASSIGTIESVASALDELPRKYLKIRQEIGANTTLNYEAKLAAWNEADENRSREYAALQGRMTKITSDELEKQRVARLRTREDAVESERRAAEQASEAWAEGIDKITQAQAAADRQLDRRHNATTDPAAQAAIERERKAVHDKYAAEFRAYIDNANAMDADFARRMQSWRDQAAGVFRGIRDQASQSFGADNVTLEALQGIQATLDVIASQRRGEVSYLGND